MALRGVFETEDVTVRFEMADGGWKVVIDYKDFSRAQAAKQQDAPLSEDLIDSRSYELLKLLNNVELGALLALQAGLGEELGEGATHGISEAGIVVDALYMVVEPLLEGAPEGARPIP